DVSVVVPQDIYSYPNPHSPGSANELTERMGGVMGRYLSETVKIKTAEAPAVVSSLAVAPQALVPQTMAELDQNSIRNDNASLPNLVAASGRGSQVG
ncbi:MAG: hypothetical protein ACK5WQ_06800, partial [Alphaproteobacteria bacterium]